MISYKKNQIKDVFKFLIQFFIFLVLSTPGELKYLFLIFILPFLLLSIKNFKIKYSEVLLLIPIIFIIIWGSFLSLLNHNFTIFSFKQVVFYILPILTAYLFLKSEKNDVTKIIDYQFVCVSIIGIFLYSKNFSFENLLESQYAFIFGIYVIYYFYRKKKIFFIFSVIFLILSNKRIANLTTIISIIILIFFSYINNKKKKNILKIYIIYIIFNYIYIYIVKYDILLVYLNKYNINTQGRLAIYKLMSQFYQFKINFVGKGLGFVLNELKHINNISFLNVHNDILSLYIEQGFIGFFLFFYFYYYIFKKYFNWFYIENAVMIVILFLYTFMLYYTDNISIYINYLFPFYLVLYYFMK